MLMINAGYISWNSPPLFWYCQSTLSLATLTLTNILLLLPTPRSKPKMRGLHILFPESLLPGQFWCVYVLALPHMRACMFACAYCECKNYSCRRTFSVTQYLLALNCLHGHKRFQKRTKLHFINGKKARFVRWGWQRSNPRGSLVRAGVCYHKR